MCDLDHGFCSKCRKNGYKLRKWCRAGKKAEECCNLSFCVAKPVTEDITCGPCAQAKQRREANDMLERKQRMERMEKMDKVRKAMETRMQDVDKVGKAMETKKGMEEIVGRDTETGKGMHGARKGTEIRKAMDIMRVVNGESQKSPVDSEQHGGGG